jgi:hypothetical protein
LFNKTPTLRPSADGESAVGLFNKKVLYITKLLICTQTALQSESGCCTSDVFTLRTLLAELIYFTCFTLLALLYLLSVSRAAAKISCLARFTTDLRRFTRFTTDLHLLGSLYSLYSLYY